VVQVCIVVGSHSTPGCMLALPWVERRRHLRRPHPTCLRAARRMDASVRPFGVVHPLRGSLCGESATRSLNCRPRSSLEAPPQAGGGQPLPEKFFLFILSNRHRCCLSLIF
jgi:hypothetical protein